jgi:hypothetical protein
MLSGAEQRFGLLIPELTPGQFRCVLFDADKRIEGLRRGAASFRAGLRHVA